MLCDPDLSYMCKGHGRPDPKITSPRQGFPFVHTCEFTAWKPLKRRTDQTEPVGELLFEPKDHGELDEIPRCRDMTMEVPEDGNIEAAICRADSCGICKHAMGLLGTE